MQPAKASVGFFVGDELPFVFNNPGALWNPPQGKHAASMDRRGAHANAAAFIFAYSHLSFQEFAANLGSRLTIVLHPLDELHHPLSRCLVLVLTEQPLAHAVDFAALQALV